MPKANSFLRTAGVLSAPNLKINSDVESQLEVCEGIREMWGYTVNHGQEAGREATLRLNGCVSSCRQALLASSLLPPLAKLLDDSSTSCRRNVHRVLNHLSLLPAGSSCKVALYQRPTIFPVLTVFTVSTSSCRCSCSPQSGAQTDGEAPGGEGRGGGGAGAAPLHPLLLLQAGPRARSGRRRHLAAGPQTVPSLPKCPQGGGRRHDGA